LEEARCIFFDDNNQQQQTLTTTQYLIFLLGGCWWSFGHSLRSDSARPGQPAHLLACFLYPWEQEDWTMSGLLPIFSFWSFNLIIYVCNLVGGGKDDLSGTMIGLKRMGACVYTLNLVIGTPGGKGWFYFWGKREG
jgi:hypothetical protein